jgi:hypothetical protein
MTVLQSDCRFAKASRNDKETIMKKSPFQSSACWGEKLQTTQTSINTEYLDHAFH